MKRNTVSAVLLICFLISFLFSGMTAATTVKDTAVSTYVSNCASLYSLSSPATLLLPIVLVLAVLALGCFFVKQRNVGFLFTVIATAAYIAFLVWYSSETKNQSQYNVLNQMLKDLGVKAKKRDIVISVTPNLFCYVTAAVGALTAFVSLPSLKTRSVRYRLKQELEPYLFIAPHVFFFVVFSLVPIIYGIYAAFTKWDLYNEPVFAGLSNFQTILFDSSNTYYKNLRLGLGNTVLFVIYTVPLCMILPLLLAVFMRNVTRGSKFFQAVYYLPALMSTTTVMLAWDYFFRKTYGMANNFFMSTADWFTPPYSWIMLVIVTVWWSAGTNMVIFQSALASIPGDQYEAAAIDGANGWQKFRFVTLPGMQYPLMYTLVTTVVAQFNVYGQPKLLLDYKNSGANAVLLMYIRDTAFSQGVAGIASAMALILGLIIMVVSYFQIRMMRGSEA